MSYKNGGCRTAGQDFQGDLDIGVAFSDLSVTQAAWVTLWPERKRAFNTDNELEKTKFQLENGNEWMMNTFINGGDEFHYPGGHVRLNKQLFTF